jgi:hypothetical protein
VLALGLALCAAACGGAPQPAPQAETPATPPAAAAPASAVPPTVTAVAVRGDEVVVEGREFAPGIAVNLFQQQGGAAVNLGGLGDNGRPRIALASFSPTALAFAVPAGMRAGGFYVELVNPPYGPATRSRDEPAAHGTLAR